MSSLGSLGPSVTDSHGELGNLSSREPAARNPPLAKEWDKGGTISGDKGFPGCYLFVDCFIAAHGVDNICLKQKHISHDSTGCNLKDSYLLQKSQAVGIWSGTDGAEISCLQDQAAACISVVTSRKCPVKNHGQPLPSLGVLVDHPSTSSSLNS